MRARALAHIMERKTICIGADELIVGERGPAPKGTPTFPELCCHTLEDFDILNSREKISYRVDPEARRIQEREIIPFWAGRSMRDRIFREMEPAWKDAYEAGIYTEFMEQRAPGHTVLGDIIYRKGLLDLQAEIRRALAALDFFDDPAAYDKQQELKAMAIAVRRGDALRGAARGKSGGDGGGGSGTPRGGPNSSASPPSARTCRRMPRAISGRRCKPTGSSTWASSPS